MAKEVTKIIKLQLPAGAATPAPPVGTALGPAGVNIAQFVKRQIDTQHPTLDARLPNGSRIHAVLPPAARRMV